MDQQDSFVIPNFAAHLQQDLAFPEFHPRSGTMSPRLENNYLGVVSGNPQDLYQNGYESQNSPFMNGRMMPPMGNNGNGDFYQHRQPVCSLFSSNCDE